MLGKLRIYNGPSSGTATLDDFPAARRCISLNVGEVLPLLAEAIDSNRAWLRDFEDDEITISTDLYEVLMAYQQLQRSGA